ncbi:MAG: HAMP domain-containing sensor histidine kinase [Pseudomonadota bacterium]
MDRASVLAGAPFRTALYAAVVFAFVLFGAGWFAYQRVEAALQQNLEAQILEEQILLHEILRDGGGEALGRAVTELNSPLSSQRHMVGVFDENGQHLAGNIDLAPDFIGWQVRSSGERSFLGLQDGNLLNASLQDSLQTVVGRSLAPKNQALTTLIEGLMLLSIVVLLTTLSLGYVLSRRNLLKLQTIEQTLNQVSLGDMAARLPVSPSNDQIDRIAAQVNEHLEQLSALMTTTKSSVAAIAHDLKTPLSHGFMALQQALGKLERAEDPREELENLESELERLSSVFDTILRISRIEMAGAQTYFDNMDLNDVVSEMHDTFAAVAEEKGQAFVAGSGNSDEVVIWGDHKMLLQLAYNLVKNAIEHCPNGTKIELLADNRDDAPQLIIADNGPGVADDLRASIFDPFFRTSSSRSSGGNGLGLALVRAIATRHGARVRAYDNGPGLRVSVTFPKKDKLRDVAA